MFATARQQHFQNSRYGTPQRHTVPGDQLIPTHRILFLADARQYQSGAGRQAAEHIEYGHVVVQRGYRHEHVDLAHAPV